MILSILLPPTLFVVILIGIIAAIVGVLIVAATIVIIYCRGHKGMQMNYAQAPNVNDSFYPLKHTHLRV